MYFKNRQDAGRQLCQLLSAYKGQDVVVYGLPRGGVPVAAEIAKFLNARLDLVFAHNINHPYSPEHTVAALSENGRLIGSPEHAQFLKGGWIEREKEFQIQEMGKKRQHYFKGHQIIPVEGRTAIIVDDGAGTGLRMKAAIMGLQARKPKQIIVALPVAPKSSVDSLRNVATGIVLHEEDDADFLKSVGSYYDDFTTVQDSEIILLLRLNLLFRNNGPQSPQVPE